LILEISNPIAIDYVVRGPQTVAALMRAQAELLGMTLFDGRGDPELVIGNVDEHLIQLGNRPRVYDDVIFSRAVEMQNRLPAADEIGDSQLMMKVAGLDRISGNGAANNRTQTSESLVEESARRVQETWNRFQQLSNNDGAWRRVYAGIELPVVDATLEMSVNGLPINMERLEALHDRSAVEMEIARGRFQELAGTNVNLQSAQEVASQIYEGLGISPHVWTATGKPSTRDSVLERLVELNPRAPRLRQLVDAIHQYRAAKKGLDTARALLAAVNPFTSRVHAELRQCGADTGRSACRRPNLQGLPAAARDVVEAEPGYRLIKADVSQCELRVLAHLCQESAMLSAFARNEDLHTHAAAVALGIDAASVTRDHRNTIGKRLNFAVIYGETEYGLAERLGRPLEESRELLETYFRNYPRVRQWIDRVQQQATTCGYAETVYGRRRSLPDIWSSDSGKRAHALRQAVNTVVQGTAADLHKMAIARLYHALPHNVRLLLPVHDAILLEVPESDVEDVRGIVKSAMEVLPSPMTVPLPVDIQVGRTWGECADI
jgi:DNA polymerase-1